jgi:hypothetical protein
MLIVREKTMRDFSSLVNINQTRLKDGILSKVPDIKAYQKKRGGVILVFEKDVGQTMITAFKYTDVTCMYLRKAAEIAQKETI